MFFVPIPKDAEQKTPLAFHNMPKNPLRKNFFLLAHNIRSLYNVGAFFRTADALGIDKIFFSGFTPTPSLPKHQIKISKTALGAEKWVSWEYGRSPIRILKKLKAEKFNIIALENNLSGKTFDIRKYKPKFPLVLVVGEEVGGIKKNILNMADKILEIPQKGKKESLNVASALAIAAFFLNSK